MVRYRRNRESGGTYFFTVTPRDRRSDLLVREVDVLRESWRVAKERVPHDVVASVVLPDHIHAVLTMTDGQDDFPRLWQEVEKGFTRRLGAASPWQPRYWEHTIRDARDLGAHVDYVHINPVKHGLVSRASDWPQSSIHRFIARGEIAVDWACDLEAAGKFGET